MKKRFFLSCACILLLISLAAVPVLAATVSCPSSCSCLLPADAKKMGYYGSCGGEEQVCGYDSLKNGKYCFTKPVTTTKVPRVIVTGYQFVTTTTTPVPAACPSDCSCFSLADGKKNGYSLCGGKLVLCGYTPNQQPKYCHATGPARARILGTNLTVIAAATTAPSFGDVLPAVASRCTVSGTIRGFWYDTSSLRVRFTNVDGNSSDHYVFPSMHGDYIEGYSYLGVVPCTGVTRVEPVYRPAEGVCPWTGTFTPSGGIEVSTTGSSAGGQDFTFTPSDFGAPEVEIVVDPPFPAKSSDGIEVTVRGRDETEITNMTLRVVGLEADRRRTQMDIPLDPARSPVQKAGQPPAWSDSKFFRWPSMVSMDFTARVCDAGGNGASRSMTLLFGACNDSTMNRDETGTDCGGTFCPACGGPQPMYLFSGTCDDNIRNQNEEQIDCSGVCPACIPCTWCPEYVVPLRIQGTPDDRIDVLFIPDIDYGGNMSRFASDVQDAMINGYYRNNAIAAHRDLFNFYYLDAAANAESSFFSAPLDAHDCEPFQDVTSFADSIGIIHVTEFRDYADTQCERRIFTSEPTSYRTFVHESGHSVFGLRDEYCCDSLYNQNNPWPNIWANLTGCRDDAWSAGWDPGDCRNFCPAGSDRCGGGFWDIDPPHCIMGCSQMCNETVLAGCGDSDNPMCQFEPACERRVEYVFDHYD